MLLDQNSELQLRATKPKPLVISIVVHVLLILFLALTPSWFDTALHRKIRINGEDYDVTLLDLRPLTLPSPRQPRAVPAPAPQPPPAAQPPPPVVQPQQAAPPPPPPPAATPQPTPPPPDRVIRPDDLLAEGARPDGTPRASRGDTREQARQGGPQAQEAQEAQKTLEAQKAQEARQNPQQAGKQQDNNANKTLPNLNPKALRAPETFLNSADRIIEATLAQNAQSGRNQTMGRTGTARGDNIGTFSTDPQILSPNPKGIDFGPYLNGLLNRLRSNWYSVMPEMARLGQKGRVDVIFTVGKDGTVKDLQVVSNSGYEALDKGALSAIQLSNPFQRLPAEYETDLKLRIAFLYNIEP